MYDIIGKRKHTYIFSALLMIISLSALGVFGLKLGIDFIGGTLLEVQSTNADLLTREELCQSISQDICTESFIVQKSEDNRVIIRYKESDEDENKEVLAAITATDPGMEILRTDFIGATVSEQLKSNTVTAILLSVAMILIYIAFAFRRISFPVSSWSYGFSAIVALVHDIVIVLGLFSIFGYFFDVEIGIPFIAALLTILGYSINDTIVVYDRVRENILRTKNLNQFPQLLNQSLNETLARSMNTSLTVVVVLIAMIIWGSPSLLWFSVALLIGVLAGTYSSIFVATALVVSIYYYKKKKGLLSD